MIGDTDRFFLLVLFDCEYYNMQNVGEVEMVYRPFLEELPKKRRIIHKLMNR